MRDRVDERKKNRRRRKKEIIDQQKNNSSRTTMVDFDLQIFFQRKLKWMRSDNFFQKAVKSETDASN